MVGNGGEVGDNANYDGYANSVYSVTVSAVDFAGKRTTYRYVPLFIYFCQDVEILHKTTITSILSLHKYL